MANRRWIVEEILEESSASGTGQLFNVDGYGLMTPVKIIKELTEDYIPPHVPVAFVSTTPHAGRDNK